MAIPSAASSYTRRNAPAETSDDYKTFQFGQYKGEFFKEITEEEPRYYEWAKNNNQHEKNTNNKKNNSTNNKKKKKKKHKPAKYLLEYAERVGAIYDYESQEHRPTIDLGTVPRTKMTRAELLQLSGSSDSNCVRTFESGSVSGNLLSQSSRMIPPEADDVHIAHGRPRPSTSSSTDAAHVARQDVR
eukprot:965385-Heterocapsa_arctica.AAC.1